MFKSIYLSLALAGSAIMPAQALIPLPNANGEYQRDANGNVTIQNQSFRDFQAVRSGGSFEADPGVVQQLGYDPSRSWLAGDRPEDIVRFGDIKDYGLATYSLQELNPGEDVGNLPLSSLRILESQTVRELATSIPRVGRTKIKHIPPLKDNLPKVVHDKTVNQLLNTDVFQLRSDLEAGARQEASYLSSQGIERQQNQLNAGYRQGVELIAQNVNDRYPEVELNLQVVTNATNLRTNTQLDRAAQRLKQRVARHVQNDLLSISQVGSQIQQEYVQYQTEAGQILAENTQQYRANIEQQVSQELTQAGLPSNLNLTTEFDNLGRAVSDFANETIADAQAEISTAVNSKLAEVEQLSRRIPTEIGELELGDYDLDSYKVDDIPGAASTPIEQYENYKENAVSDVPGAADLDFDRYPFMPQFGTGIARVDWIFSNAEKYTDRTISGSIKDTFNLAHCRERQSIDGNGCAHVELIDELIAFNAGKQWVSGDSQEVGGGKNALRGDGKEPTGRLPAYKSPGKMVLRNLDELTDTVEMFLAIQICVVDPFGTEHCTPHDVVEIPVWTFKPGDLIFLGVT